MTTLVTNQLMQTLHQVMRVAGCRSWRTWFLCACAGLCCLWHGVFALAASAETQAPPMTLDELDLARWASRVGDRSALGFMSAGHTSAERFVAVQAAPRLRDPERALPVLAELIGGRDPDLAPNAALAAVHIAQALTADDLARREVLFEDLKPAITAFRKLDKRTDLRPDMRMQVTQVLMQLEAFAVTTGRSSGAAGKNVADSK